MTLTRTAEDGRLPSGGAKTRRGNAVLPSKLTNILAVGGNAVIPQKPTPNWGSFAKPFRALRLRRAGIGRGAGGGDLPGAPAAKHNTVAREYAERTLDKENVYVNL